MDIPGGLGEHEEWSAIRRMQGREVKGEWVDWLLSLATWHTKADLTFESVAHGVEKMDQSTTIQYWVP